MTRSDMVSRAPSAFNSAAISTVEIAVEAAYDLAPSDKRRFALLCVPRELFNKALGEATRRSKSERSAIVAEGR